MNYTVEDQALMTHAPAVPVPALGMFVPMAGFGHRFLLARDGLWMEVRRPWLHLIWPIAQQSQVTLPYGKLEESIDLAFEMPVWGLQELVPAAREASPAEVGAAMIWNEGTSSLRFEMCKTISAGTGTLTQSMPDLGDGDWIAVDLHSHGPLEAGFSQTDIDDTGAEVVIAGVIGRIQQVDPEVALSLFALGLEIPLVRARSPLCSALT